jgi:AcrR family transcriptional regulator
MNDKKMQIIQAAIKLFGERDYHSASIQDIVSLAGVSKGAFYLHFHSKEELLVSIFKHYFDSFFSQLDQALLDQALSTKQILIKSISLQCQLIMGNKDFLSMQVKGIAFTQNEAIQEFFFRHNLLSLAWFRERIIELYGPEVAPHSIDLAAMLNGMLKEYFFYFICHHHPIDSDKLSHNLVERLDDLAHGLLIKKTDPILSAELLFQNSSSGQEDPLWETKLEQLKQLITDSVTDLKSVETMILAVDAIAAEFVKEDGNDIIIQGMYTYLLNLSKEHAQLTDRIEALLAARICKA